MNQLLSISPVSVISYDIPTMEKDPELEVFLNDNKNKSIVVVQGLGFVGLAMSLVIANANECAEFAVIGVDLPSEASYWKIGDIKTQNCPVISSDPLWRSTSGRL